MKISSTFPFKIEHIDPLGQGVSKNLDDQKIDFIYKTLPGEVGTATSYKEKGKLRFATIEDPSEITDPSPDRIEAICPHYNQCLGCHFLHTSYEKELEYKLRSFEFMSKSLKYKSSPQKIKTIYCNDRLGYRNRVQLHYDKKSKKLGFIRKDKNSIIPVKNCKLPLAPIQEKLQALYRDEHWLDIVADHKNKGHIEILKSKDNANATIHINKKYSAGGFTQVNEPMNIKLTDYIYKIIMDDSEKMGHIVDLFGGNGNLTKKLVNFNVHIYDGTPSHLIKAQGHQTYHQIDLYKKDIINEMPDRKEITNYLIVDPPRSGIKNLSQFVDKFKPKKIIYVSCHPQTMIRDIHSLQESHPFYVKELILLDLFPSTYHFESMAILEG